MTDIYFSILFSRHATNCINIRRMGDVHMQDITLEPGERDRKNFFSVKKRISANYYCRYACTTSILSQTVLPLQDLTCVYTPAYIFIGGHIYRQVIYKCILDKYYASICQQHHCKKAGLLLSCLSPFLSLC